jgi:hypothetical protein
VVTPPGVACSRDGSDEHGKRVALQRPTGRRPNHTLRAGERLKISAGSRRQPSGASASTRTSPERLGRITRS